MLHTFRTFRMVCPGFRPVTAGLHPGSKTRPLPGLAHVPIASAPCSNKSQIPMLCIGEKGETEGIELLPTAGIS